MPLRMTPEREALLDELGRDLSRRGVEAVLLRGPNVPPGSPRSGESHPHGEGSPDESHAGNDVAILVRPQQAAAARRALDGTGWRFELGTWGAWRMFRTARYLFDEGLELDLHWGVPGSPAPFRPIRALERALWEGSTDGWAGFRIPDPQSLLVYLCCQAARLGLREEHRFEAWNVDVADCADGVEDWRRVWTLARKARVVGAIRRALARGGGGHSPPPRSRESRAERYAWTLAGLAQRHAWPRRARGFVAAAPRLGRMTTKTRFHGLDLLVGRGVFIPRALAEATVDLALDSLPGAGPAQVVDVGTGCGAVGLALAAARPDVHVHATEISRRALAWASWNRRRLALPNVTLYRGSLLDPLPPGLHERIAVMAANVPYVRPDMWAGSWQSPRFTIVGSGTDGLGLYRDLVRQAKSILIPGGHLIMQLEAEQWSSFSAELSAMGYEPSEVLVRMGDDTIVRARLPETG